MLNVTLAQKAEKLMGNVFIVKCSNIELQYSHVFFFKLFSGFSAFRRIPTIPMLKA